MSKDAREPALELLNTLLLFAERGEVAAVAKAIGLDQAVRESAAEHLATQVRTDPAERADSRAN